MKYTLAIQSRNQPVGIVGAFYINIDKAVVKTSQREQVLVTLDLLE